jgi:hypothetical protein
LSRSGSRIRTDRTQWLVLRGTLKEADLAPFLDMATSSDVGIVTLDLCDLATLTQGALDDPSAR